MVKKILIGLAAVIVVFAVIVAMQPAEFRVMRSATIAAPAPVVFAQVNDFHKWEAWSPWEKLDPNMKKTYEGAPAGTGAIYAWSGNKDVGEGRMTLTESRPNELIRIQPAEFRVTRSTTIAAPAPLVFAQVNDFHKWEAWSPWEKLDPNMKKTYEGAPPEPAQSTRGRATRMSAKGG